MNKRSYVIGMDVGGTNVRIGAVSRDGGLENIEICSSSILVSDLPAIEGTIKFIQEYIDKYGYKDIEAISIGFPSTVSKDRKVIYSVPNLRVDNPEHGFDNKNVVDPLSKAFGVPVFINNDVNNLLQCEITAQGLKDKGSVLGFFIGTGYGNSIYINDAFLFGKNGVAGELGHIPVYKCDLVCNCGKRGCVECISSGFVLRRIWEESYSDTDISNIFLNHADDEVLVDFVEASAIPIATEVNIFDPDYIVIGGGVVNMAGFPKARLEKFIIEHTRKPYPAQNLQILYAQHEQEGGLLGAAFYARERLSSEELGKKG